MPLRYVKRHTQLPVEHSTLPFGMQNLSADLDRLGVDKDESDHASFGTAIDPIVDRTSTSPAFRWAKVLSSSPDMTTA